MSALDRVLEALDAADCRPRPAGNGWQALCPAHDDRNPSLAIHQGDSGALVRCHAGCETTDVAGALRMELRDLFDEAATPPAPTAKPTTKALPSQEALAHWTAGLDTTPSRELVTRRGWSVGAIRELGVGWDGDRFTIPIRDDAGELLNVVRYRPDAKPKSLALTGRPRGLFPAPETLNGSPVVFVVEGEPDALAAASIGLVAVAIPGANAWRSQWARRFAGRHVVIVPDCDHPGRDLAARAARDLTTHAASVRLLDLGPLQPNDQDGYDLGDFIREAVEEALDAGGNADTARQGVHRLLLDRARRLPTVQADRALALTPEPAPPSPSSTPHLRELDVARMLREEPPPVAWLAEPLLVRGYVTMLAGREGQGKSMLALAVAAAVGHGANVAGLDCQEGRVLYIDAENGANEAHRRIRGLSVANPGRLAYIEADGFHLGDHVNELQLVIQRHQPELVVLDSFRSLWPGGDENDSAVVEPIIQRLARLAREHDLAVLLLHHAARGTGEYRGSTAIGGAVGLGFTLRRHQGDPEERERRELACWKSRPAPEPDPLCSSSATTTAPSPSTKPTPTTRPTPPRGRPPSGSSSAGTSSPSSSDTVPRHAPTSSAGKGSTATTAPRAVPSTTP